MDLRDLKYFVAIADQEHFGRASKQLRIAQPALSRRMKSLEHEIGGDLFERLPRGVRLTRLGQFFLKDAKWIVAEANLVRDRAQQAAHGRFGIIRVGFVESSTSTDVVSKTFTGFRREFPNVELRLSPMTSWAQLAAMAAGALDCGFIYECPDHPTRGKARLDNHEVILAVPANHKIAKLDDLKLSNLCQQTFVWLERISNPPLIDRVDVACRKARLDARVVQEAPNEATLLTLVGNGMGMAFVSSVVETLPRSGVVFKRVKDLHISIGLDIVWILEHASAPIVRFVEMARGIGNSTQKQR